VRVGEDVLRSLGGKKHHSTAAHSNVQKFALREFLVDSYSRFNQPSYLHRHLHFPLVSGKSICMDLQRSPTGSELPVIR
jgi:hypothetical protein